MRRSLVVLIVLGIGVVVTLVMLATVVLRSDSGVRSVADRVHPPSGWMLTKERVTAKTVLCLGDSRCPSLFREWTVQHRLSRQEFERVLSEAGFDFAVVGDCLVPPQSVGKFDTCTAKGIYDAYSVELGVAGSSQNTSSSLWIDIKHATQ